LSNFIQELFDHPQSDEAFSSELEHAVLERLHSGAISFARLASDVEGAWPVETLQALRRLERSGHVRTGDLGLLLSYDEAHGSEKSESESGDLALPDPHPLHFDWRFSAKTRHFLLEKIAHEGPSSIALLGVPSLFHSLLHSGHQVRLFDRNDSLEKIMRGTETNHFQCIDLMQPMPTHFQARLVVADPPWYIEHYAAFLQRTREVLEPGGKAFISVLPRLTRPKAADDRTAIVALAYRCGLDLLEVTPGSLVYDTPPFEESALRSEGLVLPNWRKADLYVFVKSDRTAVPFPIAGMKDDPSAHEWRIYLFGKTSIAVRCGNGLSGKFFFRPTSVSGEFVLHSVSRRSKARSTANVWSSKNHALSATRTDCVCRLFGLLAEGREMNTALGTIVEEYRLDLSSRQELARLLEVLEICMR
jgi:hypothetical protein